MNIRAKHENKCFGRYLMKLAEAKERPPKDKLRRMERDEL